MRIRSPPGDDEPRSVRDHRAQAAPGYGKLGDPRAAGGPGVTGGQQLHIASRSDSTRRCAKRYQMIVPAGRTRYPV
jgi:hypothetical protein